MLRVSPRPAGDRPATVTSNIISRTRRAAGRACVMAGLAAVTTTGSNSTPAGKSSKSPREPSAEPPHPAASTPPNPPGTPSDQEETGTSPVPDGRGLAPPEETAVLGHMQP